ncbi:MAG: trypsin-like peptidase domain-containing protein [Acidobacteria bacterium]|nr:trypsin-like peptidase domain-containing protein [Acidobacteriota bacterium]
MSEKTWLLSGNLRVPLTPVARDEEADLALFRLPDRTGLPSFPYPVGDSETLRLGDPIAVLGADPVAGPIFRPGSVAGLHGSAAMQSVTRGDRVFLMSLALASGESGAPILAARGGSYEMVGVAQGTYIGPRQLAWAIRIGPGLESLARRDASDEVRRFVRLCRGAQVAGTARCAPDSLRAEGKAGSRPTVTPPFTVSLRQKSPLKPPGFRP